MNDIIKTQLSRRNFLTAAAGTAAGALAMTQMGGAAHAAGKQYVVGFLPKFTGHPYFVACNAGAQTAAKELGMTIDYNGPVDSNVQAQSDIIDRWVRRRVDCIAVSATDPDALVPALQRAKDAGIKTITWDADARQESRSYFLNPVSFDAFGSSWIDMLVEDMGKDEGEILIVTSVLTAPNQNAWIDAAKKYAAQKHPKLKFPAILPGDEDVEKSRTVALNYLRANPQTVGVIAATASATPGAVEAVKQLGLLDKVAVTGSGIPSMIRPYLKDGSLKNVVLWNPVDVGYGTIYLAKAVIEGTVDTAKGEVEGGHLGKMKIAGNDGTIILGPPFKITKENVDQFKF